MDMICKNCGKTAAQEDVFCRECGKILEFPNSADAVEKLVDVMDHDRDWMTRLKAAYFLMRYDDPRGKEYLEKALQSRDPDTRETAREILAGTVAFDETMTAPNETTPAPLPPEPTRREKILDFTIGFIGWYVVNGIFWIADFLRGGYSISAWMLVYLFRGGYSISVNDTMQTLPVNLLILIVLAAIKRTRRIAFGILLAMAVNFVIALLLGNFQAGACLIPFFFRF